MSKMSERNYGISYSDNYLLMLLSDDDVTTQSERDALKEWKLREAMVGILREQSWFLNDVLKSFPSRESEEYKKYLAEINLCHNAMSAYEQKESKIRSGRILKPLAQQVFTQVRNATQGNYNAEMAYVRKHDANYLKAIEMLYTKESQSEDGKYNQEHSNSSPLIYALDKKISKEQEEKKLIEAKLNKLKWCFSKEKRMHKAVLTQELNNQNTYLNRLQNNRRLWVVIRYRARFV